MIEGILGIIEKMRIEVYPNKGFNDFEVEKTIFVQVNPESYTINHEVKFCEEQVMGASSQDLDFNQLGSEEVSFDFIFDSSGVIPPAKILDGQVEKIPLTDSLIDVLKPAIANPFEQAATVDKELNAFKKLVSGYDGKNHQTKYLRLLWGAYLLECRLTSISIEYKLFRRDGRPIRAIAKCKFKGTQSYEEMNAEQNKQSPDVTHKKIIHQGDMVTLLAEQMYGQNQFYVDVAKFNKMLSFRKLNVDESLLFPPIK